MLKEPPDHLKHSALTALFHPKRIALAGASERPDSPGSVIWKNLSGFPGEVLPVTSSGQAIGNSPSYRSLLDIDGPIDLVIIAVPAPAVPTVICEAGEKQARACVVISSGFAETGADGAALQQRVKEAAALAGVRIIGPNCYGVQNSSTKLNASIAPTGPDSAGTISLITQSGAYGMALHTLAEDEQLTFDKVIATGNKIDVTDSELLAYLSSQGTGPLCFFLESLPDGRAFFDTARLVTSHRPVIVCRTGTSASGRRAARSHTASLAGTARVWSAAFAQAGIIETRSGLEMLDVARALEKQSPPRGNRVGVITNSGGVGVEITDLLAEEGLRVPQISEPIRRELAKHLPAHGSSDNPIDVTTAWRRFPELYGRAIDELARSGEVDSIVAVQLQRSATHIVSEAVADVSCRLRRDGIQVPIFVCWVAGRDAHQAAQPLREAGIPVFEWPQRTARAVAHATKYGTSPAVPRESSSARAQAGHDNEPHSDTAATTRTDGWLPVSDAANLLTSYGIPLARWGRYSTAEVAAREAAGYRRPVVLKVDHPDLLHKSDESGVILHLNSDAQIMEAARRLLLLRENASLIIEEQEEGLEVIVGGIRDAEFGPMVMVGLGGVHAETTNDVQLAVAPVSNGEAVAMLRNLRGAPMLLGRRSVPVDLDALAAVVTDLGTMLLEHDDIVEVDLNPVMAREDSCVVVDWRIRSASSSRWDQG